MQFEFAATIERSHRALSRSGRIVRMVMSALPLCAISIQANSAENFFDEPDRLCSALAAEGLPTNGWRPSRAFPGEWLCMSNMSSFGTEGPNLMENNIAFYVMGTSPNRVDDIRIKININNSSERRQAFARLESATRFLFKAISEPLPEPLSKALAAQEPVSVSLPYGSVELIFEPSRIDSFKVVLTDVRYQAAKERARKRSAGKFELCKTAVAKAAGYSVSFLSGDGDLIQETGYQSFLFKGRGKDLFFCEMHAGNHYKIKAALDGKFPFQKIADGKF